MVATLRIKKVYFDQILSGTKRVEYRDVKPFYDRLFSRKISTLKLHYQSGRQLVAQVDSINRIATPEHLKQTGIAFSAEVYAIVLRCATLTHA